MSLLYTTECSITYCSTGQSWSRSQYPDKFTTSSCHVLIGHFWAWLMQESPWNAERTGYWTGELFVTVAGQPNEGVSPHSYHMAFFAMPQSTAIKIVKPTVSEVDSSGKQRLRKDSVQRQCKNIFIYGHCKYQYKGCTYSHPPPTDVPLSPPSSPPLPESTAMGTLTAQAVNAPVFVPKSAVAAAAAAAAAVAKTASSTEATPSSPRLPPTTESVSSVYSSTTLADDTEQDKAEQPSQDYSAEGEQALGYDSDYASTYDYPTTEDTNGTHSMEASDTNYYEQTSMEYQSHHGYEQEVMDAAYYNQPPVFLRQPLNYLLYTPSIPPELVRNTSNGHFVPASSDLRQLLQERSESILGVAPIGLRLPEELQGYHTLVPIEPSGANVERRKLGNWLSVVYRAIRTSDGIPYALRRIENYRLTQQSAFAPIEVWSQIQHPNIIAVREAFTTRSFGDNSLVVVYAYHPNAQTLYEAHIKPKAPAYQQPVYYGRHQQLQKYQQAQHQVLPERTLWSYIVQLASAIKKVHERGQAVRMLDVTKILVTGQNRIRISSCGIVDILMHDTPQDMHTLQQEDLLMFGQVVFALCCNNVAASIPQHLQTSLETIGRIYSMDVKNVALFLIGHTRQRNIDQLLDMIRSRVLTEQDEALMATDKLEYELSGELENARLVRLLCKFGFINERPEFARDQRWSETGDRYIVKLFRDYVFHQVDEMGNPVLDLSHVLTCLNKVDAGTDERVMLVARDEQSCLVVSYKEIKSCVASAFNDLTRVTKGTV